MTNNANAKDKNTIHLLKRASKQKREISAQREHELSATVAPLYLARQLGHRSPQVTLYPMYTCLTANTCLIASNSY